jgi:hypothetical protein
MPRNVARFERLIYASLAIGYIAVLADLGRLAKLGPILAILTGNVVGLAATMLLGWLAARRRAGWARWVLLAVYLVGLPLVLGGLFITEVGDVRVERPSAFVMSLVALAAIAQGAALAHIFTADARAWFSSAGKPAAFADPGARYRVKAGRRVVADPGEFDQRGLINAFIEEMEELGVGSYTAAPPNFRLLWAMGINVPPPFFLGALPLTLIAGVPFALFWAVGMSLAMWLVQRALPLWLVAAVSALAGLAVGLAMAAYYRWRADTLPLPAWEDYLPPR